MSKRASIEPKPAGRPREVVESRGGYAKLYGSILRSSVWLEDPETRITWIALLAMADATGYVEGSIPGIAHTANVSLKGCRLALEKFQAPDADSHDPEFDGRRLEKVERGFRLLNYAKYREYRSPKQIQNAERQGRFRGR